jgi:hypothetical protein
MWAARGERWHLLHPLGHARDLVEPAFQSDVDSAAAEALHDVRAFLALKEPSSYSCFRNAFFMVDSD